jgi:hypothetical protein
MGPERRTPGVIAIFHVESHTACPSANLTRRVGGLRRPARTGRRLAPPVAPSANLTTGTFPGEDVLASSARDPFAMEGVGGDLKRARSASGTLVNKRKRSAREWLGRDATNSGLPDFQKSALDSRNILWDQCFRPITGSKALLFDRPKAVRPSSAAIPDAAILTTLRNRSACDAGHPGLCRGRFVVYPVDGRTVDG